MPHPAPIDALCVFCGSSRGADPRHAGDAARLGRILAENDVRLVFGGGLNGLMGVMADAALDAGGLVTGVIPHHLVNREVAHRGVSELIEVDTMHARKQRMFELSDAVAVLPGGIGTLDETVEMLSWKQLGLHGKPVVLVDSGGYWRPFAALLDAFVENGFARPAIRELFLSVGDVGDVLPAIATAREAAVPSRPELF
ncbi:MAG: TIGR00730 family Rossman fold protein [Acetobacterales bacterium]